MRTHGVDFSNLQLGFELKHPTPPLCASCGLAIDRDETGHEEEPMWYFQTIDGRRFSIALHWKCLQPRMGPRK